MHSKHRDGGSAAQPFFSHPALLDSALRRHGTDVGCGPVLSALDSIAHYVNPAHRGAAEQCTELLGWTGLPVSNWWRSENAGLAEAAPANESAGTADEEQGTVIVARTNDNAGESERV
uniref:Uncharacterized protein n=1 Tax=Chrysotila carterae TaxID=13221 RepID=A0A7S4BA33_CHRCT|mmetsp:Transcript_12246/g.26167  ORF Transcript_12246/g.26167 Transcript_12246/m.26167 type:complete len:118 (-) Transcript_12246:633-986(-)